jgi:hypothetical protein
MVFPARNAKQISQCSKLALKDGFFSGQLIVDSAGRTLTIREAKKLRGIGRFGGYNIFLNQQIEVALIFEENLGQVDLESIRGRVLLAFRDNHGWSATDDIDILRKSVQEADSIATINRVVTEAYHRRYPE